MIELANKIRDAGDLLDECVIGWDSMNEPGEGLIGFVDLGVIPKTQALKSVFCHRVLLEMEQGLTDISQYAFRRKGPSPTAFQGMRLGMGEAVTVENWVRVSIIRSASLMVKLKLRLVRHGRF